MSKNVYDVRNMCLEMTLCVQACFVKFYVFVLDEIYVRGFKHQEDRIWVSNFWDIIPKNHPRVLEEGTKFVA